MKKLLLLLSIIVLLGTKLIFAQWNQKTNGLPNDWIIGLSIDSSNDNSIVISLRTEYPENNKLFITTNNGGSWTELIWPFNDNWEEASDVFIIDTNNLWFATDQGRIYNSTYGGSTWELQYYEPLETTFLNYIEMFDLNNGIAMGDALDPESGPAVFLKTSNGGTTWESVNNTAFGGWSGDVWRRLDFVSPEIGYFYESGVSPQKLYKTNDGGYNWQETNYEGGLQLVKFYDQDLGLAFGFRYINDDFDNPISTIHRTTDGGENWESIEISSEGYPNDFEFLPGNPNFVWFTTLAGLYYSTDMGATWSEHYVMDGELRGRDIVFTDDNHGWLLCDNGRVYYTENNGGIVTDVDDNMYSNVPSSFQLNQNYPNPFNPETVISFQIPTSEALSEAETPVLLKVYDILGNEVTTLVDEYKSPGTYEVEFNGSKLSSGVYFYTLQAGNFSETKKLVLMK